MMFVFLTLFTMVQPVQAQTCADDPVVRSYAERVERDENVQSCSQCAVLGTYFCEARQVWEEADKQRYREVIGQGQSNVRELGEPMCCPELLTRRIEWGRPPAGAAATSATTSSSARSADAMAEDALLGGASLLLDVGMGIYGDAQRARAEKQAAERARAEYDDEMRARALSRLTEETDPRLLPALRTATLASGVEVGRGWAAAFSILEGRVERTDLSTGEVTWLPTGSMSSMHECTWQKRCVRVSPDGTELYYAGPDRTVRAFDARSGAARGQVGIADGVRQGAAYEQGFAVTHFDVSPDGSTLVINDRSTGIGVYDLPSGTLRATLSAASRSDWKRLDLEDVYFAPDTGRYAFLRIRPSAELDFLNNGRVYLADLQEGRMLALPPEVLAATKVPGEEVLVCHASDGGVYTVPISTIRAGGAFASSSWTRRFSVMAHDEPSKPGWLDRVVMAPGSSVVAGIGFDLHKALPSRRGPMLYLHDLETGRTESYETNFFMAIPDLLLRPDLDRIFVSGQVSNNPVTRGYALSVLIPRAPARTKPAPTETIAPPRPAPSPTPTPSPTPAPPPRPAAAPVEVRIDLVPVPSGTYGDSAKITVTRPFLLGRTEVTNAQYAAVTGQADATGCPDCPVPTVSFHEAAAFANALSRREGLEVCYELGDGNAIAWPRGLDCTGYRLPTEAEWGLAAATGGEDLAARGSALDAIAWHAGNSDGVPHPVASRRANAHGVYDLSGNVREWVWSAGLPRLATGTFTDPYSAELGVAWAGTSCVDEPLHGAKQSGGFSGPGARWTATGFRVARSAR